MHKLNGYLYHFLNLKLLHKIGIILLLYSCVTILVFLNLMSRYQSDMLNKRMSLNQMNMSLLEQETDIAKIAEYEHKRKQLEQEWKTLQTKWLSAERINNIFDDVETIATRAQVHLNHIMVDQMLAVTIASSYTQFIHFLDLLMEHPYLMLTDLQIKREKNELTAILNLNILLVSDDL